MQYSESYDVIVIGGGLRMHPVSSLLPRFYLAFILFYCPTDPQQAVQT
jgi:sterol desaturase/sphingolipid hydroxylase (fatty acid hydroxylase superfamily)